MLRLYEPVSRAQRDEIEAEGDALLRFLEPDAARHVLELPKR